MFVVNVEIFLIVMIFCISCFLGEGGFTRSSNKIVESLGGSFFTYLFVNES